MALPDFALFLIEQARALHEPGEPASEYTRGQAELIVDAAGLSMDEHRDEVIRLITRARGLMQGDRIEARWNDRTSGYGIGMDGS